LTFKAYGGKMANILIVDDSDFIRSTLKEILESSGHIVVAEASTGEEAFAAYALHKPDLVTMDITMSGMDGISTIKKIITYSPQAKIIVISAINNRELLFKAMQFGAKCYILKPFSTYEVIETVSETLA
jgi:two-component system, chemotaxis family, chemotaxis protein CheY